MAGIVLEFSHHGDFDSFGIIRSSTPTSLANLPSPLVTGLSTMFYVDTAVVVGQTYYYRAVVWRDGDMVVGDEVAITAVVGDIHWSKTKVLLHFENNFTDATGRVWANSGVSFSETVKKFGTAALFRNASNSSLSTPRTADFNWWEYGAYTIEAFVQAPTASYTPSGVGRSDMICCTDNGQSLYEWGFGINERNKLSFAYWGGAEKLVEGTRQLNDNQFHHIAMTFDGAVIRLFADGNLEAQANIEGTLMNYNTPLRIGAGTGFDSHQFYLDEVRITPGVCRYADNFTVTSSPFPDA